MLRVMKTVVNSNQTQKIFMELPRQCFQQKIHIAAQSSHITKRTKLLISDFFVRFKWKEKVNCKKHLNFNNLVPHYSIAK